MGRSQVKAEILRSLRSLRMTVAALALTSALASTFSVSPKSAPRSSLPIQFGGGIRTVDDVARAMALGATRVVLGTVAVRQPEVVAQAVARFGVERIVVGIDARDGMVATHGWLETSALDALTVARRMADLGVLRIVFTDIARDGTLTGVNVAATAALARASGLKIIASGGVGGLADIRALAAHISDGIEGVIVGQALYIGTVSLQEALSIGAGLSADT